MDVTATVEELDRELRAAGTPTRAANEKRYLKSDLEFYGVTLPEIRRIAKGWLRSDPSAERAGILGVVRELWSEPVHERRMLATILLEQRVALLDPADIALVEQLIRDSKTWALVDVLAASVAGPMLERHVDATTVLDRWAGDDDFWIRRSALLSHLGPLRRGEGDFARFGRYADGMLEEREFFIRKAIGWVLRDTSRRRPDLVYEWMVERAHRASGVTVREAVKRLPDDQSEEIMRAYRTRRPAGAPERPS